MWVMVNTQHDIHCRRCCWRAPALDLWWSGPTKWALLHGGCSFAGDEHGWQGQPSALHCTWAPPFMSSPSKAIHSQSATGLRPALLCPPGKLTNVNKYCLHVLSCIPLAPMHEFLTLSKGNCMPPTAFSTGGVVHNASVGCDCICYA